MTVLPLGNKAIVRLFSGAKFSDRVLSKIAATTDNIASFMERVQHLRWQLGSLSEDLHAKSEHLASLKLEKYVHECLFDILQGVQSGTREQFLTLIQSRISQMLSSLLPDCFLRQVNKLDVEKEDPYVLHKVNSTPLLPENDDNLSLIRARDHRLEKKDLLEDFLDHLADKTVHQISVQTAHFKFIFHRHLPKCDSNLFNLSRDESIAPEVKFVVQLLGQCLEPVIL